MTAAGADLNDRGLRLTRAGAAVGVASILTGGAGWLLGLPELVVPAVAGLIAVLLALVATAAPLPVVLERRFRPERVTVDGPAAGLLRFTNRGRLPMPGLMAVDHVGGRPLSQRVPGIGAGGTTVVRNLLPTDRRGRLELGPVRVERIDPLGLVTRWRSMGAADVLWVRPRVHAADPIPTGVVLDLEGPTSDTATEGTLTFSSLREYVRGDDLRRIHWPTTARTGALMVRTHVDTSQPRATLVLDTRDGVWEPARFEHGIEVVASLAAAFRRVGHGVEVRIVGEDRTASARLGARSDLDRLTLAQVDERGGTQKLFGLIERSEGGGALVVVTGDPEARLVARVATQRRRHAPVVVVRLVADAQVSSHRRSGVLEVVARTAVAAVASWNREVRR